MHSREVLALPAESAHVKLGGQTQSHHAVLLNKVHSHLSKGAACHYYFGTPTAMLVTRVFNNERDPMVGG